MKRIVALLLVLVSSFAVSAGVPSPADFGGTVRLDKTVHDFGSISVKDGPVSCTFTVTNIGSEPLTIFAVMTSCGCTSVKWTREDIAPGASGTIEASYTNDEGPYPFDKNLTVYLSTYKKPVVLHMKGVAQNKKK